jgi:HPt (histidine-containing phosphotransfer) domain-containing protein
MSTDLPDPLTFDAGDFVERLMGNEDLAGRVARAFLASMPGQLAALSKAIDRADAHATTLTAHSIKGAAANVSGDTLREAASMLEKLGESGALASAPPVLAELEAAYRALQRELQRFCDRS